MNPSVIVSTFSSFNRKGKQHFLETKSNYIFLNLTRNFPRMSASQVFPENLTYFLYFTVKNAITAVLIKKDAYQAAQLMNLFYNISFKVYCLKITIPCFKRQSFSKVSFLWIKETVLHKTPWKDNIWHLLPTRDL